MIQRIQSLYLFFAAVCMLLMLIAPIETILAHPQNLVVKGNELHWSIILIIILTTLIILFSILSFKNRITQKRICFISIVLAGSSFLSAFFGAAATSLPIKVVGIVYQWGLALPLISVVLLFLAINAINKDEKLVRSADRLR
jgi:peptidoglycan/LPS O-acetylase OafA/YrhL